MNARVRAIAGLELAHCARRPLYWFWILLVGITLFGLSTGSARIQTGDSDVGGTKAWITSEFAQAQALSAIVALFYTFFVAIAAGMSILRDDELRVSELLHATPLRPREYVLGRFLAALLSFLAVLALHVGLAVFFNHVLNGPEAAEYVGPLVPSAYLRPALLIALPTIVFVAGGAFWVGERGRKPILVFVLPVALLLGCAFFLWTFTPTWLDPRIDRALMLVDPSGLRWLERTWLTVDRGVDFYNSAPVGYDLPFLGSRLLFLGLGLVAVRSAALHFERTLRGGDLGARRQAGGRPAPARTRPSIVPEPLALLSMHSRAPGFVAGTLAVARAELRELRSQPGLYLFAPLILLQVVTSSMTALGAFDTPLLATPGTLATSSLGLLTTLLCLLLLFYVVESLRREEGTRLAPILHATSVRSTSLVAGKAVANSLVAVVILAVALCAQGLVVLLQGRVRFELLPFLIVWGLLLVPTLLFWSSYVSLAYALTRSRYTTYALGLSLLVLTGLQLTLGEMDWLLNWPLYGALRWSDMGIFELDRSSLVLNRALVLSLALLLGFLAVRLFPRRGLDATRTLLRLRPGALARAGLALSPLALPPLALGIALGVGIRNGWQGEARKEEAKDYWRKNVATWLDAPVPDLSRVDLRLALEPVRRHLRVEGVYELVNRNEQPLAAIPLTGGLHWREISWTLAGEPYEPEDRKRLYVFRPSAPLAPGQSVEIGFRFEGEFPEGATRNGGGAGEFVLPSGVVLTSFSPSFTPVIGFVEGLGIDEDNRHDAREYPDDFHAGLTPSAFGAGAPYPVRVRIDAPEEYRMCSVGTLVSEEVADGRRSVVWETEHPVRFFNVIGGRWAERRGEGTLIQHHPAHDYNVDEMIVALDAARRHYGEWFGPFPWKELRLSEFPALADYAQGFPTNITFSESIGFLTRSDARTNLAFLVVAHEAAHQWWGNLLVPGRGPGGNVLSEGMAHFSTILLFDAVHGPEQRIEFARRIEESYAEGRQVDSERPLVKIDGSRAGDGTVIYDKGGWVFWMLLGELGRERALEGLRTFIERYRESRDHPVLQDFVAHMRAFASDLEAYDAFVAQWFFDVVLPRYEILSAERTTTEGGHELRARLRNTGTGRAWVELAALRGERFPSEDDDGAEPYREARERALLGPGEEAELLFRTDFEPTQLVVDPDALVLQADRKHARREL